MQGADRNTLFFAKICLNKKSSLLPDWSGQAKPDKLSLKIYNNREEIRQFKWKRSGSMVRIMAFGPWDLGLSKGCAVNLYNTIDSCHGTIYPFDMSNRSNCLIVCYSILKGSIRNLMQ